MNQPINKVYNKLISPLPPKPRSWFTRNKEGFIIGFFLGFILISINYFFFGDSVCKVESFSSCNPLQTILAVFMFFIGMIAVFILDKFSVTQLSPGFMFVGYLLFLLVSGLIGATIDNLINKLK